MKPVTKNLIANYAGRGWAMVINLIATPLIIKIVGIESYGLIGFYTTMYGLVNLLDFGISPTINRELAQYSIDSEKWGRGRDLVRTLEIFYWSIGVLLGIGVYYGAPFIATNWLQSSNLSIETLTMSIRLMGFLIVLEWPITFYQGALLGLQKHVRLNILNIINGLLKFGGGIFVLTYISSTIDMFFFWQLIISAVFIIFLVFFVWHSLPPKKEIPVFDYHLLEKIWRFALSLNMISFVGLVIRQMDKIFVSHYFSLEIFGYYNLANMVSNGFTILVSPIYTTYFPKLSTLVAQKDEIALRQIYHQACQLVSVAILPAATIGILYSRNILVLWTGNVSISTNAALITSLLLMGTILNALASMPYEAQIAHGWTKLTLIINLISFPILFIAMIVFSNMYGINGIAAIWVLYGFGTIFFSLFFMHKRILLGEIGHWLKEDTLPPVIICTFIGILIFYTKSMNLLISDNLFIIILIALSTQLLCLLSVPYTRKKFLEVLYFGKGFLHLPF